MTVISPTLTCIGITLVSRPRNSMYFVAIKNKPL
jgi:hypothetical protein